MPDYPEEMRRVPGDDRETRLRKRDMRVAWLQRDLKEPEPKVIIKTVIERVEVPVEVEKIVKVPGPIKYIEREPSQPSGRTIPEPEAVYNATVSEPVEAETSKSFNLEKLPQDILDEMSRENVPHGQQQEWLWRKYREVQGLMMMGAGEQYARLHESMARALYKASGGAVEVV